MAKPKKIKPGPPNVAKGVSAKKRPKAPRWSGTAEMRREEAVRLALALTPVGVIATRLGITRHRAGDILAEPEVRARIVAAEATAMKDAIARRRQLTRRAVEVLAERMEDKNGQVAVRAAQLVLSGSGADAAKKIDLGLLAGSTDAELDAELERILAEEASDDDGGEGGAA